MTPAQLETEVMVHRYLYYVLAQPAMSDYDYDILERQAREVCGEESPVHDVGSDCESDYPKEIVYLAEGRLE